MHLVHMGVIQLYEFSTLGAIILYHYIISNKDSLERRNLCKFEFTKLGIEPHFFDAIMGTDMFKEELQSQLYGGGLAKCR